MKRNLKLLPLSAFVVLIALALNSCTREEPAAATATTTATETPATTPTTEPGDNEVEGEAPVESIQILKLESFPVQVDVRVRGSLPDGCTSIDETNVARNGNAFEVAITTIRQADVACTQALVPFEQTISLDVLGLEAGTYTVTVNGHTGSFTLEVDNTLDAATPEPTARPTEATTASINGRVWHDLCAITGVEGGATPTPTAESGATPTPTPTAESGTAEAPPEGCVATADGASFQANGLLETDEPGIEGVTVNLGQGQCPATDLATTTTDANGDYIFVDLSPGAYCVSIDPLAEENSEILLPGGWTVPEDDSGAAAVTVNGSQNETDVNFGWDYQFLPLPEVDPATCTNSIEFVEDLSIPDNTVFPPGAELVKSWRLRNNGTCPWTTEYSLVVVGGDEIPGPESVPLTEPVAPGQTVDLSVTLTAPAEPGTYRSNWQLSNATGQPFGVNGFIEDAFWVQIIVEEGAGTPAPRSATIGGVVWDDSCFLSSDGAPSPGCVETAEGSGVYRADGTLNFSELTLGGVVVTLSANACPPDAIITAANVLATATTDEAGLYRFTGLDAGTYCVSIDALGDENVDLLIPGDWTYPALGTGLIGIILGAGEERLNVDFGWDDLE